MNSNSALLALFLPFTPLLGSDLPGVDQTVPTAVPSATPTVSPKTILPAGPKDQDQGQLPGLTVKDGEFFLHGKPYRGMGVNYYDLFQRVLKNPADHSSLEGLDTLAKAGVPFVRYAGPYGAKDWQHYLSDKEGFFAAMDQVVKTAETSGIGLIPSLLWEPTLNEIVGEHGDAWGDSKSRTIELMRSYVTEMVKRYKDSPAIWAWEMGNEWNLKVDLPNAPQRRKPGQTERDDLTSKSVSVLNSEFCSTIRAVDSMRPIITGDSHPRSDAWHNTHENNWHKDYEEQWKEMLLRDSIASTDTLGIHLYADEDPKASLGEWTSGYSDYISHLKKVAQEKRVPIFIGEFGLAEDSKLAQDQIKERFTQLLNAIEQGGIDLSAVWVYDFPGQKDTWNITFTNPRAYMLEEVIAANKRLNQK